MKNLTLLLLSLTFLTSIDARAQLQEAREIDEAKTVLRSKTGVSFQCSASYPAVRCRDALRSAAAQLDQDLAALAKRVGTPFQCSLFMRPSQCLTGINNAAGILPFSTKYVKAVHINERSNDFSADRGYLSVRYDDAQMGRYVASVLR